MLRRSLFVSVLILGMVGIATNFHLSTAQNNGAPERIEIGGINDENFPELTVLVNVWDEYGVPVPDLADEDFQLSVNGTARPVQVVENITRDSLPISVVLAIDTSESMLGEPLADAKAAALRFLERLDPQDEVALIGFSSQVRLVTDFTTDREMLRAEIEGLTAGGRTALYDATYFAAQHAQESQYPRRFAVFLTDGNEYGGLSAQSAQAGIRLAGENNMPFYVIGLGFWLDQPYLNSLANTTRGDTYFYPDSTTLTQAYEYLGDYLRTQNVVTINSGLEPDGSTHDLVVTVNGLTEVASYTTPDLYPQLTFEGLPEDAIGEPVTVTAQVEAVRGLASQSVMLDGVALDVSFDPLGENMVAADITLDPYAFDPTMSHTLTLSATDAAGGMRSVTVEFSVSDVPPVVTIIGPDDGAFISEDAFGVGVTVEQVQQPLQAVEYRVDGQAVAQVTEPPYAATLDVLPFGPGEHTLEIALIDASGEVVEGREFTVDPELFVTPTATPTATFTATNTPTATFTPTNTPTDTPTATFTPTNTPTATFTSTNTPTEEPTATATATFTEEPSVTPTEEPTEEPTADLGATADAMAAMMTATATRWTETPTETPTEFPTEEPTETPIEEPTADLAATADAMAMVMTATATQWTATPTETPTVTPTEEPTEEPTETPTEEPTADLAATADAMAMVMTATATQWTATPTETATETPTDEPTEMPTETATETPTDEPTETPTDEPTATPTEELSETPTEEPTEEPTVEPSGTPTERATVPATATEPPEMVEQDVTEEEEAGTDLTDYWPLLLVGIIVLVVLFVVVSQLRQNRTQAGG